MMVRDLIQTLWRFWNRSEQAVNLASEFMEAYESLKHLAVVIEGRKTEEATGYAFGNVLMVFDDIYTLAEGPSYTKAGRALTEGWKVWQGFYAMARPQAKGDAVLTMALDKANAELSDVHKLAHEMLTGVRG